jgi:hypothetical protein
MKSQVLEAIGETNLQHPTQVNAALAANDSLEILLLALADGHRTR